MNEDKNPDWNEKYRPKTVKNCILPESIKSLFQSFVDKKHVPNLILTGIPGVGKTSTAKAMLDELDCDYLRINSSVKKGIDTLRDEIMSFASSMSFKGSRKYVLFDEADGLTNGIQDGLRAFLEEFSGNCGFIFTCNNLGKIHSAIQDRCDVIDFTFSKDEFKTLANEFFTSLMEILKKEEITFDKATLAQVIKKFYPRWRKIIVMMQSYASKNGKIDSGILASRKEETIQPLIVIIKSKSWSEMRKWVGENFGLLGEFTDFTKLLQKEIEKDLEIKSLPILTDLINMYDYQNYFVIDKEVNMVAFLSKVISDLLWR